MMPEPIECSHCNNEFSGAEADAISAGWVDLKVEHRKHSPVPDLACPECSERLICCEGMKWALARGTDGEGYGNLIGVALSGSEIWGFESGMDFAPIAKACPWCLKPNVKA